MSTKLPPGTLAALQADCTSEDSWTGRLIAPTSPRFNHLLDFLKKIHLPALVFFAVTFLSAIRTQGQSAQAPLPPGQNPDGMHIFIWAGLKTHPPGRHDYPQFLADWSKLLTVHGAVVDGALHPPSAADLAHTDVIVLYKGDAGFLSDEEKAVLHDYILRGGGIVSFHDSLCGPDPAYFATIVGGAKKHGEVNFTNPAPVRYTVVDKTNPIMEGMSDFTLFDEAFFNLTWAHDPDVHVLATAVIANTQWAGKHAGEVVPQIWTYEHTLPGGQPARAFVWMQGDRTENFSNYQIQQMLLRGIAWAAKQPVNTLLDYVPPPLPAQQLRTPGDYP
jgi:type 1 glutamine amidotransferase